MEINQNVGVQFRAAVEARDIDGMVAVLDPQVRLFSPVAFRPFAGREAVRELFTNLLEVFSDFRYEDELVGDGAHALIFRATVNGKELQGLDYMQFGSNGLVDRFTVMVRPASALLALGEALAPRVAHLAKD
ncbi:MAG: nuclear transport factor 2 family protein [Actinomycetia bacterium]|nr:nuclear transport factor 2 family protein [Actinomycetes bacterium]